MSASEIRVLRTRSQSATHVAALTRGYDFLSPTLKPHLTAAIPAE